MILHEVEYNPSWACPGALVATNDDGLVLYFQCNPENGLTRYYYNDEDDEYLYWDGYKNTFTSSRQLLNDE